MITQIRILKMKNLKFLFLFVIILSGFSCNSGETYFQFKELKNDEWSKLDTLYFNIDSSSIDINKKYDVFIEVTNNADYKYQNIWLYIFDNFENDRFLKNEKQYLLADSTGKWFGNGFGQLYQSSLLYKKGISFTDKKDYLLKITQGMIDEPLTGIEKIGVRISNATNE